MLLVKGTLAGRMAAALRRQRRAPLAAARARRYARRDGPLPGPAGPRAGRAVFLVLAGPGELALLDDLVQSIYAYEGYGARIVVVEDATPDVRRPQVRARHPRVDVVHARWPTGGPPRLSPPLSLGLRFALAAYEFDVLCKIDTDALVTGPGLTERAARRFAEDPGLGLLGTVGLRADGVPDDYTWDAFVLGHERRWSRVVRDRLTRARAGGYDGRKIHGGVYLASRAALDALAASGDLRRQPPWWSQIGEDLWMTLGVTAAGYRLGSWGGPGEPTASASKFLPVPLEEIGPRGILAVHSVRRGSAGEPEAVVRAALRARQPPVTAA
jgi:hypothetical protein